MSVGLIFADRLRRRGRAARSTSSPKKAISGHQHQGRQDAAAHHERRDPRADDVADAEQLGRRLAARPTAALEARRSPCDGHLLPRASGACISELVDEGEAEADEHRLGARRRPSRRRSAPRRRRSPRGTVSLPCCLTMNARRSGIIIRMPSRPPSTATVMTRTSSMSKPRSSSAGIVTPTPKAIDSPAEPVVWTMLFSRIVARRVPKAFEKARNSVIDSTATGIDAETVMPTLSTRYSDDAPKMMPRTAPSSDGRPRSARASPRCPAT